MPDKDGYPTDEELEIIKNWGKDIAANNIDWPGLFSYVKHLWKWVDERVWENGGLVFFSTGGWSGNEDLITALKRNLFFNAMFWERSERGGLHVYRSPSKERTI